MSNTKALSICVLAALIGYVSIRAGADRSWVALFLAVVWLSVGDLLTRTEGLRAASLGKLHVAMKARKFSATAWLIYAVVGALCVVSVVT